MNLELLESFGQNYPEDFDGILDCMSVAITCQFNRRGTLLAVGCNDGRIFVWDFLTRGIAKIITAHVHPVCSLSWSRDGYNLLSASTDNTVCVWDVCNSECVRKYRFPSPFIKVQYNPRDNKMFLVCLLKHASLLVSDDGTYVELPLDDENDLNIISSFDRRGEFVFCGNAKGKISVYKTQTRELITTFKVTSGNANSATIKQIEFARRGNSFLVNTADRIIRVYDLNDILKLAGSRDSEPEPQQKLQDLVNRTLWKKCCFSGDGEYICAGSSRQHSLYIWEKSVGNLVKILHGTKGEMLLDVVWHPVRPLIASVSSGVVSIWSQNQVENWSAFAPDFKELDENVEYEERESEFDLEDEDKSVHSNKSREEEDVDVDVTTVQPIQAFLSSDEEGDEEKQLLFLTITPEFEDLDENVQPLPPSIDAQPPIQSQSNDSTKQTKKSKQQNINEEKQQRFETPTNEDNELSSKHQQSIKQQPVVFDIQLKNAPVNEIHPLNVGYRRPSSTAINNSNNNSSSNQLNPSSSSNNSKSSLQSTNKLLKSTSAPSTTSLPSSKRHKLNLQQQKSEILTPNDISPATPSSTTTTDTKKNESNEMQLTTD